MTPQPPAPTPAPKWITPQEAQEIALRFINQHFGNAGDKPRASIPANPDRDDDIRLLAFIAQCQPTHSAQEAAERAAREIAPAVYKDAPKCAETAYLIRTLIGEITPILARHFQAVPAQSPGSGEALREALVQDHAHNLACELHTEAFKRVNALLPVPDTMAIIEKSLVNFATAITPFLAQPATPPLPSGEAERGSLESAAAYSYNMMLLERDRAGKAEIVMNRTRLTLDNIVAQIRAGNTAPYVIQEQVKQLADAATNFINELLPDEIERINKREAFRAQAKTNEAVNWLVRLGEEAIRRDAKNHEDGEDQLGVVQQMKADLETVRSVFAQPPSVKIGDALPGDSLEDVDAALEEAGCHRVKDGITYGRAAQIEELAAKSGSLPKIGDGKDGATREALSLARDALERTLQGAPSFDGFYTLHRKALAAIVTELQQQTK